MHVCVGARGKSGDWLSRRSYADWPHPEAPITCGKITSGTVSSTSLPWCEVGRLVVVLACPPGHHHQPALLQVAGRRPRGRGGGGGTDGASRRVMTR